MINIVMYQPEIPYNTGNIGRTCVASGSRLHLIRPLGFVLSDKYIKRAGMDYWPRLDMTVHDCYEDFRKSVGDKKVWLATTKAHQVYTDVEFGPDDYIMFGPESSGIPEQILVDHEEDCIRIPMMENERSLNLCNSVAIVLYEALRQNGWPGMEQFGELHKLHWKEHGNE
ncbi:MAG: tRNA (cytidine(34)-2'-O)-methyltransferase [Eubacteriales bacterium]|nr:tRNA (cytidine(34)-2'-O)-methyltransferase [Eubacteriales bacterium]